MMQIDMGSQPKRGQVERKEVLQRHKTQFTSILPVLATMPITIGRVLISSGRAITATKQSLDWAFVEVDASDKTTYDNGDRNKLPFANSPGLYRKNASSYGRDVPEYYVRGCNRP